MDNITIKVFGRELEETLSVQKGTTIQQIADKYQSRFKSPIMIAKIGQLMRELRYKLYDDTELELFDITNVDGMRVYQRSVTFLLLSAARDVLGPDKKIMINHSIKKNLYCMIEDYLPTEQDLIGIENRMKEIVKMDLPFIKESYHLEQAIEILDNIGLSDKAELFNYRSDSYINFYQLNGMYNYFYGYMASSTRHLKWFKLIKDADGFMLMFPTVDEPDKIPVYSPVRNISEVFREYRHIGKVMNISTAGDLNRTIMENRFGETVRLAEALQEKKIAQIADMVLNKGDVKLVLIAGPSSSGKTTFAQRLSIQLRINGIMPHTISLDNYFRNRDEAPLDENGKPNFEAFEFLNVELLNENLIKLLNGETIYPPEYDFFTGKSLIKSTPFKLKENQIIIMEGIHGLNENTTISVPKDKKFKVFISALTSLNIDDHNRISTSDSRLIRRLVRDYLSRGATVERTMGMWASVLSGEAQYIFPTQHEADAVFNSSLIYELSVLKQFALPLLFSVPKHSHLYPECKRLIKFLNCFLGSPTEDIPKTSILREFIGGSCFRL